MKKITQSLFFLAMASAMLIVSCNKKTVVTDTPGCTDSKALNYNSAATKDDGSCKYEVLGCTDPNAFNYNKDATKNDGTCQFPQTDVKSAIYGITGLWDHISGEYGVPTFNKVSTDSKATVVPFNLHSSDQFSSAAGDAIMAAIFAGNSVPRMGEGVTYVFPSGLTTDNTYNAQKLTTAVNLTTAKTFSVGTGIAKSVIGDSLKITTNTKFVVAKSGTEYYLAVFILENDLLADQVTDHGTISMTHNHILRHCFSASCTGDLLASGTIPVNKVVTNKLVKKIPTTWKAANLAVATVIYYKDANGKFQFENANISE